MSKVQSVIFKKSNFTKKQASEWLKNNKYMDNGVDVKPNVFRYRQIEPSNFNSFKIKQLGDSGVELVLGFNSVKGGKVSSENLNDVIAETYSKTPKDKIGDFVLDKELSTAEQKIYHNPITKQTIVSHRGTEGTAKDWSNNAMYAVGQYEKTDRYKRGKDVQNKAESKYGKANISTVGHSQGAVLARKLGKDTKEIINVNPAHLGEKQGKNEYNVRSSTDVVSAVVPIANKIKDTATDAYNYLFKPKKKKEKTKKEQNITIEAKTYNPLTEHSADILKREPHLEIGQGRSKVLKMRKTPLLKKGGKTDASTKERLMHLKAYQLKHLIGEWLKQNPTEKIKKWKTAKKADLVQIIGERDIELKGIPLIYKNPKPPKRYPKDVLKKHIGKQFTEAEQESYLLELANDPRFQQPLEARKLTTTREGKIEYKAMQEHQTKFVKQFVFSHLNGAIAYHGVGSGKTLTAVVCAYYYLKLYPTNSVIVISPSALLFNFINEMKEYGVDPKDNRYKYLTYDKFVRNKLLYATNALLIIDEAHNFRTEIVLEADEATGQTVVKKNKKGYEIIQRGGLFAHKILALTGTAFVNTIYDIENLLAMVDKRNPASSKLFNQMLILEDARNDYFNWRISYYARSPSSTFFPERRDLFIPIIMDEDFQQKYADIENSGSEPRGYALEHYGEKDIGNLNSFYNGVLNASNSIDGIDNPKIQLITKMIKDAPDEKFIIYSALFEAGVVLLAKSLLTIGIDPVFITGMETSSKKEDSKRYFNGYDFGNPEFFDKTKLMPQQLEYVNSKYRVLIITKAGAEGVDTINCNNIILLDGQWNTAMSEQIIARAIRFKSHFGLPEPRRFVNVIRPLIIKPTDQELFDKVIETTKMEDEDEQNASWVFLKLEIDKAKKITKKEVKKKKKERDEKWAQWTQQKIAEVRAQEAKEDNEDEFEELEDESGEESLDEPEDESILSATPAIDLYLVVLAGSKQAVINSFVQFFGNKIELFEEYQKRLIPLIQAKIENLQRKLTDDEEGEIYAQLLESEKEKILKIPILDMDKLLTRQMEVSQHQNMTPPELAEYLIGLTSLKINRNPNIKILEPCAGFGDLIKPTLKYENDISIDLIESNEANRKILNDLEATAPDLLFLMDTKNFFHFLPSIRYDYIFLHPPFVMKKGESNIYNRDIYDTDFVKRAYGCLKIGGEMGCIVSNRYKEDEDFVKWMQNKSATIISKSNYTFKTSTGSKKLQDIAIITFLAKDSSSEDDELLDFTGFKIQNVSLQGKLENFETTFQQIDEKQPDNITFSIHEIEEEEGADVPDPLPAPANLAPVIKSLEERMTELEELGKARTDFAYQSDTTIASLIYSNFLTKYEKKCALFSNLSEPKKTKYKGGETLYDGIIISASSIKIDREKTNNILYANVEYFAKELLDCIRRGEELIAIPLTVVLTGGAHANMLFYRPFKKVIDRFEPHGEDYANSFKENKLLNTTLKDLFEVRMKPYLKEYTPIFRPPIEICPISGFQALEGELKLLEEEGGGYCAMWSLFACEIVFINPDKTTKECINIALDISQKDPTYLRNVIRGYVGEAEQTLKEFLESKSLPYRTFKEKVPHKNKFTSTGRYESQETEENTKAIKNHILDILLGFRAGADVPAKPITPEPHYTIDETKVQQMKLKELLMSLSVENLYALRKKWKPVGLPLKWYEDYYIKEMGKKVGKKIINDKVKDYFVGNIVKDIDILKLATFAQVIQFIKEIKGESKAKTATAKSSAKTDKDKIELIKKYLTEIHDAGTNMDILYKVIKYSNPSILPPEIKTYITSRIIPAIFPKLKTEKQIENAYQGIKTDDDYSTDALIKIFTNKKDPIEAIPYFTRERFFKAFVELDLKELLSE